MTGGRFTGAIVATMSIVPRRPEQPAKYQCEFEDIYVEHRSPEHRLARKLIAAGYPPDAPFQTVWDDGTPSLKWKSLADAAGSEVQEPANGNLRLVPWREREPSSYSEGVMEAGREAQSPISTDTIHSPTTTDDDASDSRQPDRLPERPRRERV